MIKSTITFLSAMFLSGLVCLAQDSLFVDSLEVKEEIPEVLSFQEVQTYPLAEGCDSLAPKREQMDCTTRYILQYLSKHVQYPLLALDQGIEGKVFVSFVIDETGQIADTKVLRGAVPVLDREALRAVSSMPKFTPATILEQPVRMQLTVPITFKLD